MLRIVRIEDFKSFHTELNAVFSQQTALKVYVLFFGSEDPQTGESWCPDCVIADPLIRKTLNRLATTINGDVVLIEAPCGPRSVYKNNPEHPYRVDPLIKLKFVPTLVEWAQNGPIKQLFEDDDCANASKLNSFVGLV